MIFFSVLAAPYTTSRLLSIEFDSFVVHFYKCQEKRRLRHEFLLIVVNQRENTVVSKSYENDTHIVFDAEVVECEAVLSMQWLERNLVCRSLIPSHIRLL